MDCFFQEIERFFRRNFSAGFLHQLAQKKLQGVFFSLNIIRNCGLVVKQDFLSTGSEILPRENFYLVFCSIEEKNLLFRHLQRITKPLVGYTVSEFRRSNL